MTSTPSTRRSRQILGWTGVAVAAYLAVFVLPYRFPLREPVMSPTWAAGANNQVAALALALLSTLVSFALWRHRPPQPHPSSSTQRIGRVWLLGGILAAVAWTAALGSAVARAHMYWGDQGYFLNQLRTGISFHHRLYRDFEFAYGPALYHWPALCIQALQYLHLSTPAAYLVSLAFLQAVGLALLFYTVQALPLRRSLKAATFVLLAFGTLNTLLGLNYTIFRFILPFAAVVLLTRQPSLRRAALTAAACEIAQLAVSPELGIAFAAAVLACSAYWAATRTPRWFLISLAALAGGTLFALLVGRDFFFTLGNVARGGFNILLAPAPHILVLLFAAVVLAPVTVARALPACAPADNISALTLGIYAAALALLPAALGRCDPIHIFFDGLGFWLLSFLALNTAPTRWRRLGIGILAFSFVLTQLANFRLYRYRLSLVLRLAPAQEDAGFDETSFRQAIGDAPISAPALAPQRILDDLTRSGQYLPGYFCGWVGVWDRSSEQRVISDMRRTPFALVAFNDPASPDPASDRYIARLMRFGLAHHPRRPEYIRGALLQSELKANWQPVGIYGDYALFRKLR